jgi:hypothetical protein
MRFMGGDSKPSSSQNDQFFITENIDQMGDHRVIHEEHSQESEI